MRSSLARVVLTLSVLCVSVCAQDARSNSPDKRAATGMIAGRITIKGEPAPEVAVVLLTADRRPRPRPAARSTTDADGRFRMANIPAGRYTLLPLATTTVIAERTNDNEPGKSIILEDGEALDDIDFALVQGGVITGRATDAEDAPIVSARVRLDYLDRENSEMEMPRFTSSSRTETDDRGIYRIYGLPAGRYRVSIGEAPDDYRDTGGGRRAHVRTFHPNATDIAQAKIVEVSAGGETSDVDIKVGALLEVFKLRGIVVDADTDRPVPSRAVSLGVADAAGNLIGMMRGSTTTDVKGEFVFDNLTPGRYFLMATARAGGYGATPDPDELYSESIISEVRASDIGGVRLKVRRGATLSGIVTMEDSGADAKRKITFGNARLLAHVQTYGRHIRAAPDTALINPDNSFRFAGLAPGEAHLSLYSPTDDAGVVILRVEGASTDDPNRRGGIKIDAGADVSGLRVIVAPARGAIRGRVVETTGELSMTGRRFYIGARRIDDAHPNSHFARHAEADERGRFHLERLPLGDYELTLYPHLSRGRRAAVPPAFKPVRQRVTVSGSAPVDVTLTLEAEPPPQPQP